MRISRAGAAVALQQVDNKEDNQFDYNPTPGALSTTLFFTDRQLSSPRQESLGQFLQVNLDTGESS